MKSANQEHTKRLPHRAAGPVVAFALLAVFVTAAAAQQPQPSPAKPDIAEDVEGKSGGEKDAGKPDKQGKGGRGGGRGGGKQQPPKPPPTPSYDVTFKTDVPEAEIFLNHGGMNLQSLGKTDADGKLTARLLRGTHNITASRVGYQIQRLRIDVKPGNTSFNFNLAPPGVVAKVSGERPEDPAPAAETKVSAGAEYKQSEDPLAAADAVVMRYLDAKETESVGESDWQMVRERTGAALEREPDNPQLKARALAARGQIAYLGGDYPNALVAFKQAVLASPGYTLAHYGLGNAYLATNQPAEAFKAYKQAADIDKELALALKGMGDALTKQGKTKEAAQYYSRAKSFGQTLPTNTDLASARDLKKRKRWAQALKEFQDVAATQPSAEVFVDIGDCYVGLEQPFSAAPAYRRALELDPKLALAHFKYGEVMFNEREYESALASLELAIALDPEGTTVNRKRAREMADKASEKLKKKK